MGLAYYTILIADFVRQYTGPIADLVRQFTDLVVGFVRQHPNWTAVIVSLLAFGESLAFLSLILPFWLILVAGIGPLLTDADIATFVSVVAAAAVGAALGDWLSYWIGYHYHVQVQGMWPLRNHPRLLEQGRAFFKRWGAWAVIFGRFSGPLRASVPIVAGSAEMPWIRFQLANWGSALLWSAVLLSWTSVGKWLLEHGGQWLLDHGGHWLLDHGGQRLLDLIS
jgi:membrane protein DedA with SNARE-associated domain